MSKSVSAVMRSGENPELFLRTLPSWWNKAGTWTRDLTHAYRFIGECYRKHTGADGTVMYTFEDFMQPSAAQAVYAAFRRRFPPSMWPELVILREETTGHSAKGTEFFAKVEDSDYD